MLPAKVVGFSDLPIVIGVLFWWPTAIVELLFSISLNPSCPIKWLPVIFSLALILPEAVIWDWTFKSPPTSNLETGDVSPIPTLASSASPWMSVVSVAS